MCCGFAALEEAERRQSARISKLLSPATTCAAHGQCRLLHWLDRQQVSRIAVGDVRDIANGTDKGRNQNQKLSQWAHGQFVGYLTRAPQG